MKKSKLRAVIVDDEKIARDDLKRLLSHIDEIEFLDEASNLDEAIRLCSKLSPDLVFLDIQLLNDSGFDLIEHLDDHTKVVFVTAYDEYAIKAFEVSAHDYLLKPVSLERLQQTVERLFESKSAADNADRALSIEDSLFLKLDTKYRFIRIADIKCITSADDYSELTMDGLGKGKLTNKSLREWEERLPQSHFCRIHRFSIVNIEYIENIEPWHNYSHRVYIKGVEKPLLMSRRYFSIIKEKLG